MFIGWVFGGQCRGNYPLVKGADMDAIYRKVHDNPAVRLRRVVGAIVITILYPQRDIRMKGGVS
jgi:hypothetical protein